jgi:hypothetical protein
MLSNGYKINVTWNNQLEWSPCCFYSKKTILTDTEAFNKALEYTSTATGWLPECRTCYRMEESGATGTNPRNASFRKIPIDVENGKCASLEINVDLLCNAACLSCGAYASSTWKKYEYKHGLTDYGPQEKTVYIDRADKCFTDLINTVDLSHLQHLNILGGEPMYGIINLKILKHLHKVNPALDQIMLEYQSNGSISPTEEVMELWKSFKGINFSLSLDGVGERFNYLRWPLKWHRIEKNVDFLLSNTDVMIDVNATVNPLSVWYFDELEDWVNNTIPKDRLTPRYHNPVRANRCQSPMDLNLTPLELRKDIILKYGEEHKLSKIFSNLEFNPNCKSMFDHINKHDAIRKLNWQEVFPAVTKYFKDIS